MWDLSNEFKKAFPSYLKEDILYIEENTKSKSNLNFGELTKQRVQSYWDCYYRTVYQKKEDYPGFQIIEFFDRKL